MLFEDKYKNRLFKGKTYTDPNWVGEDDCLLYSHGGGKCCQCGKFTHFVEYNYEDFFCSEECLNQFDNEIDLACNAKEICFYTSEQSLKEDAFTIYPVTPITLYKEALEQIRDDRVKEVHTTQMALLNDAWDKHFSIGARVFIHDDYGCYELKEDCERTDKELRKEHNVLKLFLAGAFNK